MIPAIFCFDDRMVAWMFPKTSVDTVIEYQRERKEGISRPRGRANWSQMSISDCIRFLYTQSGLIQSCIITSLPQYTCSKELTV